MKHGSLFTGIGGFDLAARWMGWENVFQCERDTYCQRVLKRHFPEANLHGDINSFDAKAYNGTIDIISGGFPCQPFSVAGKQRGKQDERYLWPQMRRVIREVGPQWIVGENVAGLLYMENGAILEAICTDLENEGYTVEPPFVIPACATGAWHRRDRVWIVAHTGYSAGKGYEKPRKKTDCLPESKWTKVCSGQLAGAVDNDPDNSGKRMQRGQQKTLSQIKGLQEQYDGVYAKWRERPDQFAPVLCRGNDGVSHRVDRIRALGNAIVPQVAFQIFKAIAMVENEVESDHSRNN